MQVREVQQREDEGDEDGGEEEGEGEDGEGLLDHEGVEVVTDGHDAVVLLKTERGMGGRGRGGEVGWVGRRSEGEAN